MHRVKCCYSRYDSIFLHHTTGVRVCLRKVPRTIPDCAKTASQKPLTRIPTDTTVTRIGSLYRKGFFYPKTSAFSPQPSSISPHPSSLIHQTSALSLQPSDISHLISFIPQPSYIRHRTSAFIPQPSAFRLPPSAFILQTSFSLFRPFLHKSTIKRVKNDARISSFECECFRP